MDLAVRLGLLDGYELPSDKRKLLDTLDGEFEVPRLVGEPYSPNKASREEFPSCGAVNLGGSINCGRSWACSGHVVLDALEVVKKFHLSWRQSVTFVMLGVFFP